MVVHEALGLEARGCGQFGNIARGIPAAHRLASAFGTADAKDGYRGLHERGRGLFATGKMSSSCKCRSMTVAISYARGLSGTVWPDTVAKVDGAPSSGRRLTIWKHRNAAWWRRAPARFHRVLVSTPRCRCRKQPFQFLVMLGLRAALQKKNCRQRALVFVHGN